MSIAVLVATRDRPEQAYQTWESFQMTKKHAGTRILFGIDPDEPQMDKYLSIMPDRSVYIMLAEYGSLTKVTNGLSGLFELIENATVFGSVGDDHRFRTPAWDERILKALDKPGVAYPDDGFQHEQIATAFFVHADVVRGLGWLALPVCDHMYIDNAIMDIGKGLGNLKYLPSVKIEHLHPAAGKGIMDESYRKTNARPQMEKDKIAYKLWRKHEYARDMERLKRYLDGRTGSGVPQV